MTSEAQLLGMIRDLEVRVGALQQQISGGLKGKVKTGIVDSKEFNSDSGKMRGAINMQGNYITFLERTAPGAGAANEVRVYAIVDGGSLTDLAAVFQDGTVDLFAQETTPLDAPIFTQPSGTPAKLVLRKDHPGSVRLVAAFPQGEFTIKQFEYHKAEKIAANKGAENPLPDGWVVN